MTGTASQLEATALDDVVILLARASAGALRSANAALEPFGLRARHYAMLTIAAHGTGTPQRQIGVLLGLDPSAVVALVDDLEQRGLVRRLPDPEDRRTRLVSLTHAGERLLGEVGHAAAGVHDEALAGLDERERRTLVRLLRKVIS